MKNLIFVFSIFFFVALPVMWAGEPVAVAHDYFTAGSCWDGSIENFAPVVDNDGGVALIAPMPGTDKPMTQRGVYRVSPALNADGVKVLMAPEEKHPSGVLVITRAPLYLAANGGCSAFWSISRNYMGAGNPVYRLHYADAASGTESYSALNWEDGLRILPDDSGSIAVKFSNAGALLCTLDEAMLGNGYELELTGGFKGYLPAFSGDASALYYSAVKKVEGVEWWQLWRFDMYSLQNELVDTIRPWSSANSWSDAVVSCSADGNVVAYIYANGADARNSIRVARRNASGAFEYAFASVGSDRNLSNCAAPAVSTNGLFVVFTAEDGNGRRGVWRYSVAEASLECVSGELSGCAAPAISPNGRFVAFSAPDGNGVMQGWRTDAGKSIHPETKHLSLLPGSNAWLEVQVAAEAGDTLTLAVNHEDCPLLFSDANGDAITAGVPFPLEALPLRIDAGKDVRGQWELTFTLSGGIAAAVKVTVSEFSAITSPVLRANALDDYLFTDISFSSDGKNAVFLTNAALTTEDADMADDVYLLDTASGALTLLSTGISTAVGAPAISGDGKVICWRGQDGRLYLNYSGSTEVVLTAPSGIAKFTDSTTALSYDGSIIIAARDGYMMRSLNRGETFAEVGGGVSPHLSADGSTLWFVRDGALMVMTEADTAGTSCRTVAEGVRAVGGITVSGRQALVRMNNSMYRFYDLSGSMLWEKELGDYADVAANGRYVLYSTKNNGDKAARFYRLSLASPRATPEAVTPDDGFAPGSGGISPSGKYLLFATTSPAIGTANEDVNGENDLYLHTDVNWSNSRPSSIVSSFPNLLEDKENLLPIITYLTDQNGDELAVKINSCAKGTIRRVPPAAGAKQWTFIYTPPENYTGNDEFSITIYDGTTAVKDSFTLTVNNVNDAPYWLDRDANGNALTYSIEDMDAGSVATAQILADDVDCRNSAENDRDWLTYGLKNAPAWIVIDQATGSITAAPGLFDSGNFHFEVTATDGSEEIAAPFTVTVNSAQPVTFTAAQLFNAHGNAGSTTGTPGRNEWLAEIYGCWSDLTDGWQLLSVPGECEIAALCNILGCDSIKIWNGTSFATAKTGSLTAGTGFWAKIKRNPAANATLTITPVAPVEEYTKSGLVGPMPGQAAPQCQYAAPVNGAWCNSQGWKVGRAVFVK